jgi:hypothetical protein
MFKINKKNSNHIVIIIFLLFLLVNTACKNKNNAKQLTNSYNNIGIVIIDKTILRIDPMLYSSVIGYINKGEIAFIINKSKEKMRLLNEEEYWYYVRFSGGLIGWIYGNNLKIFPADKMREIERYLSGLWVAEHEKLRKKITGTWESVETEGSSNQSIEIFEDGNYKSYRADSNTIEGGYSINFKEREIIFNKGTYFGNKITFFPLSNGNFLKKSANDAGIKFKKISSTIINVEDEKKKMANPEHR